MGFGLWLALAASVFIAYFVFHFTRKFGALIFHGVFGMVVFWLFNYFGVLSVPLNFVTFIIAAIGGVLGVALVVLFSALGVPL
ncbi:MAG: pro-sigmaK processing inhibitor BofA family protein [Candidatus Micrarchaeia archaeon]